MPARSTCTPEITQKIAQLVTGGASLVNAAPACGIPWNTCASWLARGKKGKEPFATFVAEMDKARSTWAMAQELVITKAGRGSDKRPGDWKASAWLLERRQADIYRPPTQRNEVSGPDGSPIEVLPRAEALKELRAIAATDPEVAALLKDNAG